MSEKASPVTRPGEPATIVARARLLVKLRPVVYLVGMLLGVVSAATMSQPLFIVASFVLLMPAGAALIARTSRARRVRLTSEGKIELLFAIGLLVAALNTGTNLLYGLFALLSAQLVVSLISSSMVLRALFVRRRAPSRVRAREKFPVEVSVRNGKLVAVYGLVLEEARPKGLDPACVPSSFVARVPGRDTARATYEIAFLKRGEHVLEGLAVETRFPFGLLARRVELSAPQSVLATPVVYPVRAGALEAQAIADAPARRPVASVETQAAVRSLRDYRPGDHPRMIHWRATARRGSLVVKELERSEPDRSLVVLDTWLGARATLPEADREQLLEDLVTLAASIASTLAARGEMPGLLARTPLPVLDAPGRKDAGAAAVLTTLAKLQPPEDPDLVELGLLGKRVAQGARVLIVTGRPEASAREALAGLSAPLARYYELAKPGDLAKFLDVTPANAPSADAAAKVPA